MDTPLLMSQLRCCSIIIAAAAADAATLRCLRHDISMLLRYVDTICYCRFRYAATLPPIRYVVASVATYRLMPLFVAYADAFHKQSRMRGDIVIITLFARVFRASRRLMLLMFRRCCAPPARCHVFARRYAMLYMPCYDAMFEARAPLPPRRLDVC